MNPFVELNLALILFLPWYLLLCWLFWHLRARGKGGLHKLLALTCLLASLAAAAIAGVWAYGQADTSTGAIWRQVFACVIGYGAFLSILTIGFIALRPPRTAAR